MAAHARLKSEVTEDEKCHNLTRWLNDRIISRGLFAWSCGISMQASNIFLSVQSILSTNLVGLIDQFVCVVFFLTVPWALVRSEK